ncbi:DNA-dependent ATPase fun30 [Thecaphora frezii]
MTGSPDPIFSSPFLSCDEFNRPATPKRAAKILVPDSSPLAVSDHTAVTSLRQETQPQPQRSTIPPPSTALNRLAMSGSRFQSAMDGNRSSLSKSQFAVPAPSANRNAAFRSSLQQFKYGSDAKVNSRAAIEIDKLGGSDDDTEQRPKPKKRRLVRGGRKSDDDEDQDDTSATASGRTSPVPSTSTRAQTPASSTASSNGAVGERTVVSNPHSAYEAKADRLLKVYPHLSRADVIEVVAITKGDTNKTLQILKNRKRAAVEKAAAAAFTSTKKSSPRPSPKPTASKPKATSQQRQHEVVLIDGDDDGEDRGQAGGRQDVTDITSDEEDGEEIDRADKEDRAAVKWFNTADENALMDTTNCSAAQAQTIISLRPFKDADDVESKLGDKSAKGVTPRIFNTCKELMAGYYEVDEVLARCEKVGRELSAAMASWYPDSTSTGSRLGSPAAGGASREGTPSGTLNLSTVKKGGSVHDKYYLEQQPRLLAKGVTLKDYQLVGVNWLNLLYRKKTSAILADEMGLGKTAQVISFFAHLKDTGTKGPHLVVAPSSVLENWVREFKFFAPSINVRRYWGSQKERTELREELKYDEEVEVILTTYEMASGGPADHSFLRKRGFNVCVYDEGHVLKNRKSQKYEKLLRIKSQWRLLLTGTPLQNNLQELVSLLNFIMPHYFSSAEDALAAIFKVKAGAQQNQLSKQRVDRAKKMMQPFVLRRLKDKVLTELTTKTVKVEYCDMTPVQKKIYAQALARSRAAAMGQAEQADHPRAGSRSRGGTTGARDTGHVLMELRKAANHPLLTRRIFDERKIDAMARDLMKEPDYADANFEHTKEDLRINTDAQLSFSAGSYPSTRKHVLPAREWMNAGKIQALQRLIPEIKAKGERMLIFSQFTMVLDILCVCLEHMGIKYVGFTGATQVEDRQHLVDQFTNDPEITVFLLSTKAGGLGINLVAANWVILFDQDFNPQNDKQAADRCYRMGQKKPVTVVKLICRGTIDEDIHALGERKIELAERVSGEDDIESDEAEQQKMAQTLLSQLRERPGPDVCEIEED